MTTPDIRLALQVPGQLCHTPTSLTAAFPHGGTALGEVSQVVVSPNYTVAYITYETYGTEVTEVVHTGESWVIGFSLRTWDEDALNKVFVNTAAGATSGHRVVHGAGTNPAGYTLSSKSLILCFSPDNADQHPMVMFYKAVPLVDASARLAMRRGTNLEFPIMFRALRDSSNRQVRMGMRSDLSAT